MAKSVQLSTYDIVKEHALHSKWCMCMFFSVDLAGATAYKAAMRESHTDQKRDTRWCEAFHTFYKVFPKILFEKYVERKTKEDDIHPLCQPVTWKYVGDEILFYAPVSCHRHLVDHITYFHETLKKYSNDYLDEHDQLLRCKGTSWLAGFPVNNRIILIDDSTGAKTKQPPSRIDFLGSSIDTGFRLTKFATPQKLVVSFELAWMLADYYVSMQSDNNSGWMRFHFDGRYELKGVNNSRPYPVFWLDMDYKKTSGESSLAGLEDVWLKTVQCDTSQVVTYCEEYQDKEQVIIRPFIAGDIGGRFEQRPIDFDARRERVEKFYTAK